MSVSVFHTLDLPTVYIVLALETLLTQKKTKKTTPVHLLPTLELSHVALVVCAIFFSREHAGDAECHRFVSSPLSSQHYR